MQYAIVKQHLFGFTWLKPDSHLYGFSWLLVWFFSHVTSDNWLNSSRLTDVWPSSLNVISLPVLHDSLTNVKTHTHNQSRQNNINVCWKNSALTHTHLKGRLLSDLHQGIHQLLDSFWCDVVFLTMGAMFSLLVIRTIHEASQTFPPSTHLAAGKNVGRPHFRIQLSHSS